MVTAFASDPGTLARPCTGFLGRSEHAFACTFALEDAVPLLTKIGPGAVGKTPLAVAIVPETERRFSNGVDWIDLASRGRPQLSLGWR